MIPTIDLKLAFESDASEISIMSRDLVEAGLGWTWTRSRVARSIRCRDTVVLVARAGERTAGAAVMYYGQEEASLNLLAVRPRYRRGGLGRRLVEWLEKSAVVAGVSVVYLEVRASNGGAQTFYKRLGYQSIDQVRGYYGGREAAVRMARDLWCSPATSTR